jgi:hypothetical protein
VSFPELPAWEEAEGWAGLTEDMVWDRVGGFHRRIFCGQNNSLRNRARATRSKVLQVTAGPGWRPCKLKLDLAGSRERPRLGF